MPTFEGIPGSAFDLEDLVDGSTPIGAALRAAYGLGPEVADRFDLKSNGAPGTAFRGGAWRLSGATVGSAAAPTVISGKLTKPSGLSNTGSVAGYAVLPLAHSANRLGAKFSFSSYSTGNGSATIIAWAQDITATFPTIPDSPCHLAITPTNWTYGVWSGGTLTTAATGNFATPLTADGATEYAVEVFIDRSNSHAYVALPDKTVVRVSHSLIGSVNAPFACWEYFQLAGTTDSVAAYSETWAESVLPHRDLAVVKPLTTIAPAPTVVQWSPGTNSDITVPTTAADVSVANLSATVTIPAGYTRYMVELEAAVAMTANTNVLWGYRDGGGGGAIAMEQVVNQQFSGRCRFSHVRTGLTPGTYTVVWQHFAGAAGATFKADGGAGYPAVMKVTALP